MTIPLGVAKKLSGLKEMCIRDRAGDYEHGREIPVRPRVLYDRIHERVTGDAYSRMLAVAAGGTIPDKGLYAAKTEDGVKLGELDEEFVYESQIGDKFVLGSFAWKIVSQDRDTVEMCIRDRGDPLPQIRVTQERKSREIPSASGVILWNEPGDDGDTVSTACLLYTSTENGIIKLWQIA